MNRITAWLVCLVLLLSCVPVTRAAEEAGRFYLTAATEQQTLIEPVAIAYTADQTVRQALLASQYSFEGMENGFVYAIEGTAGNYTCYYDGGGYDLDVPASGITAIVFSENASGYTEGTAELAALMGRYRERTDHVQNYAPAKAAYEAGLKSLRGTAADAKERKEALEKAISDYEAILNGPKYTLTVAASQNGQTLTQPTVTLTDAYGNETTGTGTEIRVVAGEYRFSVSDGGWNRTEGTVTVTEDRTLTVQLPAGEWFGDINILDAEKKPFDRTQDASAHTVQFLLPDTATTYGLYLNAMIGAVPDRETTRLRTIYTGVDGTDRSNVTRSWNSETTSLSQLLEPGLTGRTWMLEAQYPDADGYTEIQSYTVTMVRYPTLSALGVTAEDTVLPLDFAPETTEYTLTTVSDRVEITAEAFTAEGTTLSGTGTVSLTGPTTVHTVTVTADNGQSREYRLTLEKKEAVLVTVRAASGTETAVYNGADVCIAPVNGAYALIPGAEYTLIATRDGVYHTHQTFTASAGLTVTAAEPETADALTGLALYNSGASASRQEFVSREGFAAGRHSLTYVIPDANSALYAQATAAWGYTPVARYRKQTPVEATNGQAVSTELKYAVGVSGTTPLSGALAACGYGQRLTVRLEKTENGVTWYQDYELTLRRQEELRNLSLTAGGENLTLEDLSGKSTDFNRKVTEYAVTVPRGTDSLAYGLTFFNEVTQSPVGGGYYALVGETRLEAPAAGTMALDSDKDEELLEVQVCHVSDLSEPTVYKVHVRKTDPVAVTIRTQPENAIVFLTETATGKRIAGENGVYSLTPGTSYDYIVTCNGYVGRQVTGFTAPEQPETLTVTLTKAPESTRTQYDAAWPSFRKDDANNGVVSVSTPVKNTEAMLSWATKLGDGYSADACGCPILVGDYLYVYAMSEIYKVDTVSGQVAAKGKMDHSSSFAINTPTYADGMIFVGLSDGTVQAFDADTLDSLWIYHNPRKGQPNCPLVYHDGYLYTGFWLGETSKADFVCLSVADEDPTDPMEEKLATWTYTQLGGFYWAGAYVSDTALVVGTDDGQAGYTKGYAQILSLDPKTGFLKDAVTMPFRGDIRNSVTWYQGNCYFTSKGGYFARIGLNEDGTFTENSLRTLKLYNYADDAANPAMSTSTPTIYNGRAYVGVSGVGQFAAYSGHNITVIDLGGWDIAYTVRTQGYPQTSALLTTAYEAETGAVNVYFFDNFTPGKLRMLTDRPGQTEPDVTVVERYTDGGKTTDYETAYVLFTPSGAQMQYAICSPIVDDYGTIYFKNDSAYLMALTSTITELRLVSQPTKTQYGEGETFDPAGMKVEAVYANGKTRDVTKYVTWSPDPLTAEDGDFRIVFPYALYQDRDGETGVECEQPFATVRLTITGSVPKGDVDGDGEVTPMDAVLAYAIANGELTATQTQQQAADVDGDGDITPMDAVLIYAYSNGELDKFPG